MLKNVEFILLLNTELQNQLCEQFHPGISSGIENDSVRKLGTYTQIRDVPIHYDNKETKFLME